MVSTVATPAPLKRGVLDAYTASPITSKVASTQGTGQSACSDQGRRSFSFGRFVLVPARQLLLENGVAVRIGGRALAILSVLVCRPGETVDKAALMAQVWGRTVVEQGNLKVNMAALRRVLGERREAPSYIATINGRGYKFIASVQVADFSDLPSSPATTAATDAGAERAQSAEVDFVDRRHHEASVVSVAKGTYVGTTQGRELAAFSDAETLELIVMFQYLTKRLERLIQAPAARACRGVVCVGTQVPPGQRERRTDI
jgi:DNA-binding winged helix-turn-helix (wHTH) protein